MTDASVRLSAALAGRYRLERELGAGGMATVYLAHDEKHDRKVAIKVLKPELAAVLGAERFVVEIKTTASLSHPHILPLFDSGTADGFLFYVMPYIEGETIREKLNRETQFGVDEAIRIAREVADALDYAHRHGVIHRDIKPENILLHDGRAMVMDFGIALAVSAAAGGRMTETGLSLGTPHYMSPEQATAEKEITPRSDVYSLASVLYEMLAGQPPHVGGPAQQVIMRIITEPSRPVSEFRRNVPANVVAALARALEKLPADRFESAKAFSDALVNFAFTSALGASAPTLTRRRHALRDAVLILGGAIFAGTAALWFATQRVATSARPLTTRFTVLPADTRDVGLYSGFYTVSPDGKRVVYLSQADRLTQLYVRALEEPQSRPLAGTEGATGAACFSDDGQTLAFFTRGRLNRIPSGGGTAAPILISDTLRMGGSCVWSGDHIVFGAMESGILRTASSGGAIEVLAKPDSSRGERRFMHPRILLDGRTIAFAAEHLDGSAVIAFITPDGTVTRTTQPGIVVQPLQGGLALVMTSDRSLIGTTLDSRTLTFGKSVPILDNLLLGGLNAIGWGASANGTLAYIQSGNLSRMLLVARDGRTEPLGNELRSYMNPRVSPDGKRIAMNIGVRRSSSVWIYTLGSETLSPFTTGGGTTNPIWSRDGAQITYSILRDTGGSMIARRASDASGAADTIIRGASQRFPFEWSPDGRTLLYDEQRAAGMQVVAKTIGDSAVRPVADWAPTTRLPRLSPDGHWVAYASNASGRYEVYVSPFPGPGGHWQVSTEFGDQPVWAHNGRELFYRDRDSVLVATVKTSPAFEVVSRRKLFADLYVRGNTGDWDVMPDDQRFVMLRSSDIGGQFTIVSNWLPELRTLMGIK